MVTPLACSETCHGGLQTFLARASVIPARPLCAGALGSPGFVAPETVHDGAHTPAMDMFSLGVVLFIMLVGRKPFNIGQSENLAYCDMDIKDAPGLKDARCGSVRLKPSSQANGRKGLHTSGTLRKKDQAGSL